MKKSLISILILLLLSKISFAAPLTDYEKGQLAGSLGFGAMTIDAYYEICYSKGLRTDNHLKGIDKLLKTKWHFTYTELAASQGKRSGRDYRQEAHTLVNTAVTKTGGCETIGMKKWFKDFEKIHENNLNKFHSAQ